MKGLTTVAVLVAGAVLAAQDAHAQFSMDDLYLGFNESGAPSDYVVNLGAAGTITGLSSVVDLSSQINATTFNSIFGSPTGVGMGVVSAGATTGLQHTYDIYLTSLRNGPGNNAFANSTLAQPVAGANDAGVYSLLTQNTSWPGMAGGSSGSVGSPDASWTSTIGPAQVTGNFFSQTGNNPISDIGASGIVYEDLYRNLASSGSDYQYLGYFTLDLSTPSSPSLTFTGANVTSVPEPTFFTLFGGLGVLLLTFGRKPGLAKA